MIETNNKQASKQRQDSFEKSDEQDKGYDRGRYQSIKYS
jgi:hypothetical protein